MKTHLDYHRAGLVVEIPERQLCGVVESPRESASGSPETMVREALRQPVGTEPLGKIAQGCGSACVVITDVTRPTPNQAILPVILRTIEDAGVPRERILILIATGLHRPNEGAELAEMLGDKLPAQYRIENHRARDAEGHVDLGVTSRGVPMRVDQRYVEADLKILIGLVEPHFMAGFSGGRKLVCPGICAEETIHGFHGPDLIEHPLSTNCVLDGNPTHQTATEVALAAGVDFTLNVVLNSERELVAAFAGGLEEAFLAATKRARQTTTISIDEPADIVVISGGGYPLDATWYQSIKALVAAIPAVRAGGAIIQASGLSEGIGSAEFTALMRRTDNLDDFMRRIREPGVFFSEQWELEEFVRAAQHADIMLYSDGLPREEQEKLFVTPLKSVEEGIALALKKHGENAKILVMPHGPYVLAFPRGQET